MFFGISRDGLDSRYDLEIPTTDNGTEFKTLVQFTPLPSKTVHGVLTIVGTSETTSKGLRRVLIKVELPYASFAACGCGDDQASHQLDAAKSGASISLHMVLTLPAQAVTDLQGDTTQVKSVVNQIAILRTIMASLTRFPAFERAGVDVNLLNTDGDAEGESAPYGAAAAQLAFVASEGLTLTHVGDSPNLYLVDDIFRRGAAGLKPFKTDGYYGISGVQPKS